MISTSTPGGDSMLGVSVLTSQTWNPCMYLRIRCGSGKSSLTEVDFFERGLQPLRLVYAEALAGHDAQNQAQSGKDRREVDSSRAAGMGRQVFGDEGAVAGSEGNQEEDTFAQDKPQC